MVFEKAKVLKAAEKFLSLGNIAAAIKEYRQIVEHDEEDFTALNMLGDLCVRTGKKEDATISFLRIADHYRELGFTLKAIAMYKKIDRLNPRDPEIASKLADLYSVQGLIVDARAQYMVVAEAYSRAGDSKNALEVLHKIADLDPKNTEVRLKLAEGYLKEGLQPEAAEAFAEAGARLFQSGAFERSLQAYARALEIRPQDKGALSGSVEAHIAMGTAYEASEILEKLLLEEPGDPELLSLLLTSYLEAQDATGAERATSLLMLQDASHYTRFLEVARLHLYGGDIEAASRVLAGITERALAGREEVELLELVNEVLARDPEQIVALRLLVRIHWWQRDTEKLRAALDRLAEAAEAAGQAEDERYALTQLARLAPDELRYAERLTELGGPQEEELFDEAAIVSENAEVPTFESFAIIKEETDENLSTGEWAKDPGVEFEFNSVATETISDPSASFADLTQDLERGESTSLNEPVTAFVPPDSGDVDFSDAMLDNSANTSGGSPPTALQAERRQMMLHQELESVDFYIGQGYTEIALDTLEMLERQFSSHPAIEARRKKLKEMGAAEKLETPLPAQANEFEPAPSMRDAPVLEQKTPSDITPRIQAAEFTSDFPAAGSNGGETASTPQKWDSSLADIFEEFRVAAEHEEDSPPEDYETHYNMGLAYKEMDLLDEAIREFQTAVGLARPKDGTPRFLQCCNLLGHCFMQKGLARAAVIWFKKGLGAPGHSEDEYQALRYELGAAFEQAGDLDEAIEAFTEVYSVDVSYRHVAEKLQELQGMKAAEEK